MEKDFKKILKECVDLWKKGQDLKAFKKWNAILENEIESQSYT